MHIELVLRFVGGILGATAAFQAVVQWVGAGMLTAFQYWLVYVLCSATFGVAFLAAPYVSTRPFFALRQRIYRSTAPEVIAAGVGLIFGLLAGALAALPLSFLPGYFGLALPVAASALLAYFGIVTFLIHRHELFALFGPQRGGARPERPGEHRLLLDTSAIIDGRIADISKAGFLRGTCVVPRFVLEELQHIADSPDPLRRARGQRGLEVLARLQRESSGAVEISEEDAAHVVGADAKLVQLARTSPCAIVTGDANLERVAKLQGVEVLNINELASALKPPVLPGEELSVEVVQAGKEPGQGLAYLDDGTMVVVENGQGHIGGTVSVVVARVLQTGTGRMLFAQLRPSSDGAEP